MRMAGVMPPNTPCRAPTAPSRRSALKITNSVLAAVMLTPDTKNISMFPTIGGWPSPTRPNSPSSGSVQPLPASKNSENGSGSSLYQTVSAEIDANVGFAGAPK